MGGGRWSASDYDSYRDTNSTHTKSAHENFTATGLKPELDPKGVAVRESRDSEDNPLSTAIAVCLDVTGSMGMIANKIVQNGLGVLFENILTRKPVSDPHIMFMANGDVYSDRVPLQVSQFEADMRVVEQLSSIFLEGNGGGNDSESYNLPWWFAAHHTSIDCYEKRGKKGFLFTIGDECVPNDLTPEQIERVLGYKPESVPSNAELLKLVGQSYHVFHLMIEEGSFMRSHKSRVVRSWTELMGQNAIHVSDYTKVAEIIVSVIELVEGRTVDEVVGSWSGDTSMVVSNAVSSLTTTTGGQDVVRL